MEQEHIGHKLRTARRGRKLTQMEVAVAVGVGRSTIAGIEKGHDLPGRETLVALAEYFDMPLDWLMSRIGEG
ncbi:MAG: helix-turn-helix domain-containing protein, partial [Janthinobacterium lividum]